MTAIDEWVKTCLHKKRYSDEFADKVIVHVKRYRGVILRKYHCPHCDGWHVTKKIDGYPEAVSQLKNYQYEKI